METLLDKTGETKSGSPKCFCLGISFRQVEYKSRAGNFFFSWHKEK